VGVVDAIRGAFSFLSARSQVEERLDETEHQSCHMIRLTPEDLEQSLLDSNLTPIAAATIALMQRHGA
jgi:hypothetical protein